MNSLKVREFRNTIINALNQSDLPIEVKRLTLFEITSQLGGLADAQIEKEKKEDGNHGD